MYIITHFALRISSTSLPTLRRLRCTRRQSRLRNRRPLRRLRDRASPGLPLPPKLPLPRRHASGWNNDDGSDDGRTDIHTPSPPLRPGGSLLKHERVIPDRIHGNGMAVGTFRIFHLFCRERIALHRPACRTFPHVIIHRVQTLLEILRVIKKLIVLILGKLFSSLIRRPGTSSACCGSFCTSILRAR